MMIRSPHCTILFVVLSSALLNGCGNGNPSTYAVTGKVTYHGKAVEGAGVMFMPNAGRPASATTDAEGRFTLRTYGQNDGAIGGENIVCISKVVPVSGDATNGAMLMKTKSVLPTQYASPTSSPLKVTVSDTEPNDFTFDLTD